MSLWHVRTTGPYLLAAEGAAKVEVTHAAVEVLAEDGH